jgi:hypothetical protein
MWRQLKQKTTVRGLLYLTTDEGEKVTFENITDGSHHKARYIDQKIYDRIARKEHENSKTSIFIDWEGEHKEIRFSSNWDLWQGLRRLTGTNRHFVLQFEDATQIGDWVEGGTYRLLPDGRLLAPKIPTVTTTTKPPQENVAAPSEPEVVRELEKVDHENWEGWMTIKSDWAIVRFRKGEDTKEAFEFAFHPENRKWRLQGYPEAFTNLQWSAGLFWYEEEGRKTCQKSMKELSKRNLSPFLKNPYKSAKPKPPVTEWCEKPQEEESKADTGNRAPNPNPQISQPEPPAPAPIPPPKETVESDYRPKEYKGPKCTLTWQDKQMTLFLITKGQRRQQLLRKWFGSSEFRCYDPEEKSEIDISQCIDGVDYILKRKTPSPSPSSSGEKTVTFLTELGKKENVRFHGRFRVNPRLRVNGYACGKWPPSQYLSRNLFLRGGFSGV